jgi:mRNA-degrading endonuclease RelE of RelBE toxin-antitoxin system
VTPRSPRYTLIWQPSAVAGLLRLRATDPAAAKDVRATITSLAQDPISTLSSPLGDSGLRRLRVSNARVLYRVDQTNRAVEILTIGRIT